MTDIELLRKAWATQDHQEVDLLIDLADTEETKETLRCRSMVLYHYEEYMANCL